MLRTLNICKDSTNVIEHSNALNTNVHTKQRDRQIETLPFIPVTNPQANKQQFHCLTAKEYTNWHADGQLAISRLIVLQKSYLRINLTTIVCWVCGNWSLLSGHFSIMNFLSVGSRVYSWPILYQCEAAYIIRTRIIFRVLFWNSDSMMCPLESVHTITIQTQSKTLDFSCTQAFRPKLKQSAKKRHKLVVHQMNFWWNWNRSIRNTIDSFSANWSIWQIMTAIEMRTHSVRSIYVRAI